ncbi:hypothetical protein TNCV_3027561 [Trichonephila clavipes]|nr:hypothetical protein TNCV_3027561 [Trichonephila clavipes]
MGTEAAASGYKRSKEKAESFNMHSMSKLWRWRLVVSPSIVKIYRTFGNFSELNRTVACMVKANDRRTSSPLPL